MTASPWIARHAPLAPPGGPVLDVACGSGRHTRLFVERGHPVVAVDRDTSGIADLADDNRVEIVACDLESGDLESGDLESGAGFPFRGREFAAVVVANYLHRPILPDLVSVVGPGGVLLYETFARGNERFGRPARPEFLLEPGELLEVVRGILRVVAYEDLVLDGPRPAAVQRIAAVRA
ncbi:MAG TPA: class I SAM-dependent methyltransferase [Acidimicrobiia bacterium]|nr:class I SAM-dependent methyltransferase [Acidimicrobiia bacterium]